MARGLLASGAIVTLLAGSSARAQGVGDTCADAYEQAQQLMRDGALMRSRQELRVCMSACPAELRRDCATWLKEVQRDMPSVALSATSAGGSTPGRVRVLLDGAPWVDVIPREPVELDPGRHTLTFEDGAGTRVDAVVTLSRGDKALPIAVRFPSPAPRPAPPSSSRPAIAPGPPLWPLVLVGVGAVGLGAGAFLGIKGHLDRGELDACKPACPPDEVDAVARTWTAGGIAAGAGALVAGAGMLLYVTLDPGAPAASSEAAGIAVVPSGAGLSLRGWF